MKYLSGELHTLHILSNPGIDLSLLELDIRLDKRLYLLAEENNYDLKVYGKYTPDDDCLLISIYYSKQTCVKIFIKDFGSSSRELILQKVGATIRRELSDNIISNCLHLEDETIMTKKSMQEIEFEQYSAGKEAELKVRTQEIQHEIDSQIEQKRLECQEDMKRQQQYEIAANYWYFYQGLMEAGFNEDQAMKILLNKMPAYIPPMTCEV